ncbi:uncharacterized protein A1O5_06074 [Cladophialophora psammophila CBS 110553]|uniref:FAD-binding domain-containing protein n=1 Tax=Cladophialophora psammophila CBS 110553 TaxID=1182543 RepID=W9X2C0_9EURO|nr:uncharacterized protein A1O5_06074 [Cladophialophora psammophila CBS 110553]EXJ71081.1 hypothetical protein A1O5_06074 [Cladophialophora psammophila CBS 110553]
MIYISGDIPEVHKVLIIGAGPTGLAAALHLERQNGLSSTVYEIRPEPTALGGAVMVPCNGLRLPGSIGLYERLSLKAAQSTKNVLYSSQGEELGKLVLGSWSAEKTGYWPMRVKRTDLQEALCTEAQTEEIPIHYGKRLVSNKDHDKKVTVMFSDGSVDTADLLLGLFRHLDHLFFVPVSVLPPKGGVTNLTGTLTPHKMFALMPCTASGDTLYWVFSYEVPMPASGSSSSRDGWAERSRIEEEGFKPTLLAILNDVPTKWGALLREVVGKTDVVKFYPIYRLRLGGKWSRGRCLLIGDAAHAMSPHVGQGVSMALEDVFLLSRVLELK